MEVFYSDQKLEWIQLENIFSLKYYKFSSAKEI